MKARLFRATDLLELAVVLAFDAKYAVLRWLTLVVIAFVLFAPATDAKCYIDPLTGQKVCPLKAKASAVVQSVPFRPGETSVVVRRVAHKPCRCRCAVRQVSKCWRPRLFRRCR